MKASQKKHNKGAAQAAGSLARPKGAPERALPVEEARRAIVDMIRNDPAMVLVGETGSGKTTMVPQYILDDLVIAGGIEGMVACTQPRRVAAVSVANYVAKLRQCSIGEEVGYAVRFDEKSSKKTRLKFMTDGILLRELLNDPQLSRYSVVILDEAHERTLHGDVLFGLLKDLARHREPALKIVIMSATLNADQFSKYWWNAKIGIVRGRAFPVQLMHTDSPQVEYVDAAINTIMQIHYEEAKGDILCFLTGQEEIEDAKTVIEDRLKQNGEDLAPSASDVKSMKVMTLYAAMPYEQQLKVFEKCPEGQRKVILSTNIAETSITIEGIRYVVDSGFVKAKNVDAATGLESLSEVPVSQAQAKQRLGRAGRVAEGKCYRLYTEQGFDTLLENTVPEILRCSLSSVLLNMKAMGIDDLLNFEFMDTPEPGAVLRALEQLFQLGALDKKTGAISPLGRQMSEFPVEPMAAKSLLAGQMLGVGSDVAAIIAMISTENIFITTKADRDTADQAYMQFSHTSGDHVSLLNVFNAYRKQAARGKREEVRRWCETTAINFRQMQKVMDVYNQLMELLETVESLDVNDPNNLSEREWYEGGLATKRSRGEDAVNTSAANTTFSDESLLIMSGEAAADEQPNTQPKKSRRSGGGPQQHDRDDYAEVRRAIAYGFFGNAAYFHAGTAKYRSVVGQQELALHPTSVVYSMLKRKPALILYNNVVTTTKKYMKHVMVVREEWLAESAPNLFKLPSK